LIEQIILENKLENFVLVSPDMGSFKRTKETLKYLKGKGHSNSDIALMDKQRT